MSFSFNKNHGYKIQSIKILVGNICFLINVRIKSKIIFEKKIELYVVLNISNEIQVLYFIFDFFDSLSSSIFGFILFYHAFRLIEFFSISFSYSSLKSLLLNFFKKTEKQKSINIYRIN
jgi:hypothetical protein